MTYLEALKIKSDFTIAMQYADYTGKSCMEDFAERAKKYSKEILFEAYAILAGELDKEKKALNALFVLAIRGKIDTEQEAPSSAARDE
jgi:hypothetical protein